MTTADDHSQVNGERNNSAVVPEKDSTNSRFIVQPTEENLQMKNDKYAVKFTDDRNEPSNGCEKSKPKTPKEDDASKASKKVKEDNEDTGAEENEPKTREDECFIEIQESQQESWVPDGSWGWMVVLGGVIVHVFVGGMMKASGVMYMKLKDEFNQSAVATAWVFSLFTTFLLMMGPVASALCHRWSCRTVVFIGSVLCVIGIVISAFAPNIEFLYFSYSIVGGFGRCLTYTPSLIIVTNYFNKRRGLAVGMTTAGVGLGMFSFPPLIEALFGMYGYQGAMLLLAAISLQTFICGALFRPLDLHKRISKTSRINELVKLHRRGSVGAGLILQEVSTPKPRHRKLEEKLREDNWHGSNVFSSTTEFTFVVSEPSRRKSVFHEKMGQMKTLLKSNVPKEQRKPFLELSLLKDFPFLSLCLAILLFTMSMMSTFVFLPPLAKSKGVSQIQAAYLVSIIGISDSVARFTSGFVLDMKRVKPYRVLVYNGVMFGVGAVSMVMPSLESFGAFAAFSVMYGILAGTYVAQKSVVVVDFLGLEKMASSFGLLLGFQGIGSLVGPTISGLFRDVFGTYDEAFYFGGIGIFLGGFVLLCGNVVKIVRDRRRRRQEKAEKEEVFWDDEIEERGDKSL
ncbi:monocarboxylate transporter 12-like [Mya arenaria]|uniref:monocarboxylate transporter 12-like n=1 Tax=Mya arenaria TaxID=6604 RepID=UPI0022E3CD47|nr:monocarboxylate transporter 12-like [Mya arenaria]